METMDDVRKYTSKMSMFSEGKKASNDQISSEENSRALLLKGVLESTASLRSLLEKQNFRS